MSKIQKAIRRIKKARQAELAEQPPESIGKVVKAKPKPVVRDEPLGDDTREMAALDVEKPRRTIQIDHDALRATGFIAPEDEERMMIDQYRQIKHPLVAHAFGKRATKIDDGHLILVTSALAGDGKTFSCINLALSLAREQDRSVLLVDADVSKADISRLCGADKEPGLLDMLEDDSTLDLQDTILDTNINGLSVMTAGDMRSHSTELLASNRMERLIKALSAQDPDRIVLFDSSPLLSTSESRVLATLVGQIVMVVFAGQTPQQAVLAAIDMIDENKSVNLLLNQARHANGNGYYGTYSGYGYGAGRQEFE